MANSISHNKNGFTLLELLVVIFLLGLISTVGMVSYEGVQDESMVDVTNFEMQELKKALLQFKADNRAFPCGVYPVDGEDARPYELDEVNMVYAELPTVAVTALKKKAWCNGTTSPENNALQMLMKFPYLVSSTYYSANTDDVKTTHPLWDANTKRGWRGPYLSSAEALKDAWGGYYRLLDPELDFPAYESDKLFCYLDNTDSNNPVYKCDDGTLGVINGNNARIVSNGPDRVPDTSDDISVDLLK